MTRSDTRAAASLARCRVPRASPRPAASVLHRPSSSFSVSPRTQAVTPTNSSLHYRLHSNLHYHRHVRSQLRRRCLLWQKAITCWDDDDEEHGNEIKAGGQLRLLLPHDLLSSSCRSDLDRPITHSDLFFLCSLSLFFVVRSFLCSSSSNRWFFAVRSLVLLQVCSSSVLQVCSSSSILLWFWGSSSTKIKS